MPSLLELPRQWYGQAEVLAPFAPAVAEAFRRAALELEAALREARDEELSLVRAAAESGYSADHLGREIRRGRLRNVGRKGAPRVRRGDLPKKAALRAVTDPVIVTNTSKGQIARSVVNSERGRHDG